MGDAIVPVISSGLIPMPYDSLGDLAVFTQLGQDLIAACTGILPYKPFYGEVRYQKAIHPYEFTITVATDIGTSRYSNTFDSDSDTFSCSHQITNGIEFNYTVNQPRIKYSIDNKFINHSDAQDDIFHNHKNERCKNSVIVETPTLKYFYQFYQDLYQETNIALRTMKTRKKKPFIIHINNNNPQTVTFQIHQLDQTNTNINLVLDRNRCDRAGGYLHIGTAPPIRMLGSTRTCNQIHNEAYQAHINELIGKLSTRPKTSLSHEPYITTPVYIDYQPTPILLFRETYPIYLFKEGSLSLPFSSKDSHPQQCQLHKHALDLGEDDKVVDRALYEIHCDAPLHFEETSEVHLLECIKTKTDDQRSISCKHQGDSMSFEHLSLVSAFDDGGGALRSGRALYLVDDVDNFNNVFRSLTGIEGDCLDSRRTSKGMMVGVDYGASDGGVFLYMYYKLDGVLHESELTYEVVRSSGKIRYNCMNFLSHVSGDETTQYWRPHDFIGDKIFDLAKFVAEVSVPHEYSLSQVPRNFFETGEISTKVATI